MTPEQHDRCWAWEGRSSCCAVIDGAGLTKAGEDGWRDACRLQRPCSLVQRAAQQQRMLHGAVHLHSEQWQIISHQMQRATVNMHLAWRMARSSKPRGLLQRCGGYPRTARDCCVLHRTVGAPEQTLGTAYSATPWGRSDQPCVARR